MNIEEMEWPLSKEELEYLYWDKGMTQRKIASKFNKNQSSINYWIKKYDIKSRNSGKKIKNTNIFKKEVYKLVGNKYSIIGKYKNAYTKIKIKHNICGYKYKVQPTNFLNGNRCPKCAGRRKSAESFKEKINKITKGKYKVLGDYVNAKTKINFKHNECGSVYKVSPNKFLQGNRCPKCAHLGFSKGEKNINLFLDKNNVDRILQYSLKGCKNKKELRFDFKIKNKPIVIEYNGRQHYEPVDYFGGEEKFKYQKQNDQIKKDFCKENNIKLITIPYWEKDNIEEILEEELKEVM